MNNPENDEKEQPQTPEEAQKAFERLFAEMVDMLQMTVENINLNIDHLPPDIEERIANLEAQVALFISMSENLLQIPDSGSQPITQLIHPTPSEESSIVRAKNLLKEAEEKLKEFPQEAPPPQAKEIGDEKERRKHYKRLGRKKI